MDITCWKCVIIRGRFKLVLDGMVGARVCVCVRVCMRACVRECVSVCVWLTICHPLGASGRLPPLTSDLSLHLIVTMKYFISWPN